jgi:uncharacterized protein (DUF39 family)/predicted transcriptional regulator
LSTSKSYEEINQKIRDGDVVVVTAEEIVELVREKGEAKAAKEIDVVTTGTFGAMCSSGAWLNFGHSDPPIKMQRVWLNDVEAYTGGAAVDAYIGATQLSETRGMEYGGGNVIEDLLRGKEIDLRATAYGTDCYPRKEIETTITINDVNQAVLCNPRNAYQRYNAATNSRGETIHTYMGTLLPNYGNVTFSGAGVLSPLHKDPNYETIGIGTRIFLGGTQGYIIWEGTQHNPTKAFGTIMVIGDLKEMNPRYIRGCTIHRYGTSLYVGLGVPIPVLNEKIARTAAASEDEIKTQLLDYGVPRRDRPVLRDVTYAELRSGRIEVNGKEVPVSPLSSFKMAREIAGKLKKWIGKGEFFLSPPVELLPRDTIFKPMKQAAQVSLVKDVMTRPAITAAPDDRISGAGKLLAQGAFNHLPIVDKRGRLLGIVTSWDLAVALGTGKRKLSDIMTKKVVTVAEEEPVDVAARKLEQHNISGLPVIDADKVVKGIITSQDISKLIGRKVG